MPRQQKTEDPLPFHIGTDPEFIFVNNNNSFISTGALHQLCNQNDHDGQIGIDCDLAELRPEPSDTITGLLNNIRALLNHYHKTFHAFTWTTRALNAMRACGGHIHLEMPSDDKYDEITHQQNYAKELFSFFLPLRMTEDPSNVQRRMTSSYGRWYDWRMDRKRSNLAGNKTVFELRSPTAEWMTSPKVAYATLAYVATIHNEIINNHDNITRHNDILITNRGLLETFDRMAQNNNSKVVLDPLNKKIKKAVKTFQLYPKYKKELDWFFHEDKVLAEKAKYNYDISSGWKLEKQSAESIIAPANIDQPDTFIRTYNGNNNNLCLIPFNEDVGVDNIAHAVSRTIIKSGYKLKHKFVLFGLNQQWHEPVIANAKYDIMIGHDQFDNEAKQTSIAKTIKRMVKRFQQKDAWYIGLPRPTRTEINNNAIMDFFHSLIYRLPQDANAPAKNVPLNVAERLSNPEVPDSLTPPTRCRNCGEDEVITDPDDPSNRYCTECNYAQ